MSDTSHDTDVEPDASASTTLATSDDADDTPAARSETAPGRRRVDKGLLAACFVIAGGLGLIIWGMTSALTGSDGIDRPDAIEEISPVENAIQVLQQERVSVDLEFGYEAALIIDGIELETSRLGEVNDDVEPGQQQSTDPSTAVFDPGNARITFQPAEGAPIEEFSEGRHTAQVVFWKIEEGRDAGARTYRWSFDVI